MNVLRANINNSFKESFYEKRKKNLINVLIAFSIFHKSGVKIFLKRIVNHCSKGSR